MATAPVVRLGEPIRSDYVLIERDHLAIVIGLERERWKRAPPRSAGRSACGLPRSDRQGPAALLIIEQGSSGVARPPSRRRARPARGGCSRGAVGIGRPRAPCPR